ncbi:penicillin-binding transpeptidase domain-containing protein [Actinokineospora terrae]|uniref:NTF2-like N-terminal transpeptidase domain-containing protein n=1 Tax=Actinokineospora terrae TaxID=155974 RepID=A0A1H9TMR4_9PSEU|nr:penicillin-binding transpeptidase domain-containing protein [Actinokineospora terrae]SER98412.1 NTF2-like N-terminal transpeptidase domain-containing protein [Actinokineospora terrae]
MSQARRRVVLAVGGVAVVAIVVVALFVLLPGDRAPAPDLASAQGGTGQTTAAQPQLTPSQVSEQFLRAFSTQQFSAAAQLTDDPAAAESVLTAVNSTLRPDVVLATASVLPEDTAAQPTATFQLSWQIGGGQTWKYASSFGLVRSGQRWVVRWNPTLVHPRLVPGTKLALIGAAGQPTAVVDKDGAPVLTWQGSTARAADPKLAPMLVGAMSRSVTPQDVAGTSRIALVDGGGKEIENLFGTVTPPKEPLRTTVRVKTQNAAQAAVDSVSAPAYLVAIQPSTGGILAVAQNTTAGTAPKALNGLYPPGSTFKVVTGAAALGSGKTTANTVLPCPGSKVIGTRTIRNADFDLGDVPLHTAFAKSCNTTFAQLAADLPLDALPKAAAQFGLAADFEIPGLTTQTGRVDAASGVAQQAENSIGQGTVQTSPFGLALMAATVAKGGPVTPQLFTTVKTTVKTGYKGPSGAVIADLRSMMREVVTAGRGEALKGYGAVHGKTGTAQFGDGSQAHGWFAGYRDDVAFAVLVENAGAAAPAVAVTGKFLGAI